MAGDEVEYADIQLLMSSWQIALLFIVGVFVFSENILLLIVIFINQKLHTTSYYFIASLAISDLLVAIHCIIGVTLQIPSISAKLSNVTLFSLLTFMFVSVVGVALLSFAHMSVIAIERYMYIARPFLHQRHFKPQKIRWMITSLWILHAVFVIVIFLFEIVHAKRYTNGLVSMPLYIKLGFYFANYCLMTLITLVCYVKLFYVVRTKRLNPYTSCLAKRVYKNGEFFRSVKFFLLVFGLYFIMTFPTAVTEGFEGILPTPKWLRKLCQPLPVIHCGCNFIVLFLIDNRFRNILRTNLRTFIAKKGAAVK